MLTEIRQGKRPQTNPSLQILNQFQGGRKGMGVCFGQNQRDANLRPLKAKRKELVRVDLTITFQ